MGETENGNGQKELRRAVELREARSDRWKAEGERQLWRNLSLFGALGWLIVIPTLIGVAVGRWLDGEFQTGIVFTGACIVLGVSAGCYLAWKRMNQE
jgi:ATP synthase protein I